MEERTCISCGNQIPPRARVCPACVLRPAVTYGTPGSFDAPLPEILEADLDDLEVLELIGQGGMGAVYLARQIELDRMVALKLLPLAAGKHPEFEERFRLEARTLAQFNHPRIVAIHDFGRTRGDLYYFVMELVEQGESKDAIQEVIELCEALDYAHERGVVHRDIKPGNVLIDHDGHVKVADFGLARLTEGADFEMPLTEKGDLLGTVRYMAPEQHDPGQEIDGRADLYSAGVILYQKLTGEFPEGVYEPPSRVKPGVNKRFDAVTHRALQKDPEERFQTAREMAKAIHQANSGSRRRLAFALGLGALLVVVWVAYQLGHQSSGKGWGPLPPVVRDFGVSVFRDDFDDGDIRQNSGAGWIPVFNENKTLNEIGGTLQFETDGVIWACANIRDAAIYPLDLKKRSLTFVWEFGDLVVSKEDPINTDYVVTFGLRSASYHPSDLSNPYAQDRLKSDIAGITASIFHSEAEDDFVMVFCKNGSGEGEHDADSAGVVVGQFNFVEWKGNGYEKFYIQLNEEGFEVGWSGAGDVISGSWDALSPDPASEKGFGPGVWSYTFGKNVHEGKGGHRLRSYEVFEGPMP